MAHEIQGESYKGYSLAQRTTIKIPTELKKKLIDEADEANRRFHNLVIWKLSQ